MKSPLHVYSFVPPRGSASFYYRIQVPLMTAGDMGLPVYAQVDSANSGVSAEERARAVCEADVVYLYQPIGDAILSNVKAIQSFIPAKRNGKWTWPPTVVLDTDDNIFNVSPLNPAFKTLGINDGAGKLLPPGHHVGVVQGGEKKILYEDGKNGFNILENRHRLQTCRTLMNMSDAVVASTPECEQYVKEETKARRTFVSPNLVRMDHYEQVDIKTKPGQIRIMHQGGANHYQDLYPLREAMGRITEKYPEVRWLFWGALYPWVTNNIPPDRFDYVNWCDYSEYKLRLAMMGHHINLAPLQDTRFNRCRTAIKWYESSALKSPVATLAQNTGPYKAEMEDGVTGMLYNTPEEFEEKLCTLIENEKMRMEMGRNSKDWINENRNAFKEAPKLLEFFEQLREYRKAEQPRVTEEHWKEIEAAIAEEDAKDEASSNGKAAEEKEEANEPVHAVG